MVDRREEIGGGGGVKKYVATCKALCVTNRFGSPGYEASFSASNKIRWNLVLRSTLFFHLITKNRDL